MTCNVSCSNNTCRLGGLLCKADFTHMLVRFTRPLVRLAERGNTAPIKQRCGTAPDPQRGPQVEAGLVQGCF